MSAALLTPVLVLNKNWEAIRVVPSLRAMVYLVRGAAEAVDEDSQQYNFASWSELSRHKAQFCPDDHTFITTVRDRLMIPAIIRLLRSNRSMPHRTRLTRRNIYTRDGNTCQYCGKEFSTYDLNLDHVIPRCQGGRSTWGNLVCSCIPCNTMKGGRTPEQAGMTLIRRPSPLLIPAGLPQRVHRSWESFISEGYWTVSLQD